MIKTLIAIAGVAALGGTGSFVASTPTSAGAAILQSQYADPDGLSPCQIDAYYRCLAKTGDYSGCVHVAQNAVDCPEG